MPRLTQVLFVEGHDSGCPSVHRCFQNKFIARIMKLWTPAKVRSNRLGHSDQSIDVGASLGFCDSRRQPMLSKQTFGLVFQRQSNAQ